MKKLVAIFLLAVSSALSANAQVIDITSFFKASENQGKVLLSWQIVTGSTCNGIQIYRGTDSTQLTQIGEIIGVCGSVTEPIDYSFVDENLSKNNTYYYRLEFGTQGFSEILSINVEGLFNGTAQARPNPISTTGKIFYSKTDNKNCTLTLYDAFGRKTIEATTKNNFFTIDAFGLKNGSYFYTIVSEDGILVANNRLLVHH